MAVAAAAALLAAACGGDTATPSGPQVVRDSVADTLVVRTVSGSVWGGEARLVEEVGVGVFDGPPEQIFGSIRSIAIGPEGTIYVMDGQIPAVRVFDADGAYLRTLGRSGEGPGELSQPDGGMAMLSDGRLAVRDPGNARLQLYDPESGEGIATWPVVPSGFSTSTPLVRTRGDTLLTPVLMERDRDASEWEIGRQRIAPDGSIVDTLRAPDSGYDPPRIEARRESESGSSVSINTVPFSPNDQSAYHPDGYWIEGISDAYAVTLLRPGAWLRIEREVEPVRVPPGEKAQAEALATRNMRRTDPNWRWDGPPIPDFKAFFNDFAVAEDGRIVVGVELAGVEGDDPDYDPTEPDAVERRWRAQNALDFFETDGTYLGRVLLPDEVSSYPPPVIRGEHMWAVTADDLGVQRVVRYRIVPPSADGAAAAESAATASDAGAEGSAG
ncbi:6-bladed beta-propeller [Gaopeijia maritima]|uniref:6-bladed beta-propeller n=1 Tax=Gaopeijia maritima TaxID=3119007 RepID=A0ABU9E497_9BACT